MKKSFRVRTTRIPTEELKLDLNIEEETGDTCPNDQNSDRGIETFYQRSWTT